MDLDLLEQMLSDNEECLCLYKVLAVLLIDTTGLLFLILCVEIFDLHNQTDFLNNTKPFCDSVYLFIYFTMSYFVLTGKHIQFETIGTEAARAW